MKKIDIKLATSLIENIDNGETGEGAIWRKLVLRLVEKIEQENMDNADDLVAKLNVYLYRRLNS